MVVVCSELLPNSEVRSKSLSLSRSNLKLQHSLIRIPEALSNHHSYVHLRKDVKWMVAGGGMIRKATLNLVAEAEPQPGALP